VCRVKALHCVGEPLGEKMESEVLLILSLVWYSICGSSGGGGGFGLVSTIE
jgi:hypothetical protein